MLRSLRAVLFLAPLLALLVPVLMPGTTRALPLFAREYSMPCTQCHFAFPRLNPFGMKFRQNGYRLEGQSGQSPWENKEFPLSLVGNVGYALTRTDTADAVTGVRGSRYEGAFVQNQSEFHTAGTLAEKVTFHFDNDFAGAGGPLQSGMAFVQLDELIKGGALNVKAGVYDAEIPYLSDSRKTTLHEYLSPVTLDARGVEINGAMSGWTYAAGLVNSERDPLNSPGKRFNQLENPYVWIMRDLKGQLVTVRVFSDHQDIQLPSHAWLQRLQVEASAFLNTPRFIVIPGYTLNRFDDQPTAGAHDKHHIGLVEALVLFGGDQRWLFSVRGEIDHHAKTTLTPVEDHQLETLNLSYYVNPNARLAVEWSHTSDNVGGPKRDEMNAYVHVGY